MLLLAAGLGSWRGHEENGLRGQLPSAGQVAWSEAQLDALRRAGNPVFVDVTADWCITCLANEAAVLLTDDMTAAFKEHGVVYMVADWTNYDADIARFLERYGRTGIPLYLVYPADTSREPLILPQLLTESTVLDALRAVSTTRPGVAGNFSEDKAAIPPG